jgi:hypothetical protein
MTENKIYNGVSTFLVRDPAINGYTRLPPRKIALKLRLQAWRARLTFWSVLFLTVPLFASKQFV